MLGLIARIGFAWVRWKSRHGLRDNGVSTARAKKQEALQIGVRGEAYAYCYLRRLGYIFIARNYMPSHAKGELDLLGFDADTLAVVEVRTRLARKDPSRLAGNEHYEREARSAGARGALFSAKA